MDLFKMRLVLSLISAILIPFITEAQTNNDIDKGIQLYESKKFAEAKFFLNHIPTKILTMPRLPTIMAEFGFVKEIMTKLLTGSRKQ